MSLPSSKGWSHLTCRSTLRSLKKRFDFSYLCKQFYQFFNTSPDFLCESGYVYTAGHHINRGCNGTDKTDAVCRQVTELSSVSYWIFAGSAGVY